jgi:hypothetical protein
LQSGAHPSPTAATGWPAKPGPITAIFCPFGNQNPRPLGPWSYPFRSKPSQVRPFSRGDAFWALGLWCSIGNVTQRGALSPSTRETINKENEMKKLSALVFVASLFAGTAFAEGVSTNTGAGVSGNAAGSNINTDANNKTKAGTGGASSTTGANVGAQTPAGGAKAGAKTGADVNTGAAGKTLNNTLGK